MRFAELAAGSDEQIRLIVRRGLAGLLWHQMQRSYGYESATPGLRDFVIELFTSCLAIGNFDKLFGPDPKGFAAPLRQQ